MDGIINVYKEQGFTSHDVVAKLRGILHTKKIGHTGTLDPDAVGVLPVCLGKATKLCSLITDWDKTYEAVMLLGVATDTQDITGKELSRSPVCVSKREIVETVSSFVGEYEQIPPMYSALKHNGRKLYELARAGIEVERKARNVTIGSIHINDMNLCDAQKTVTFTVECSKGTYIRTLCDDIGKKLGCGACMQHLVRTRVGRFRVDESFTINQIAAFLLKGELQEKIVPADAVFDYPCLTAKQGCEKLLYNGCALPGDVFAKKEQDDGRMYYRESCKEEAAETTKLCRHYRVYDAKGVFIGIYELQEGLLKPVKMFYAGNSDEM